MSLKKKHPVRKKSFDLTKGIPLDLTDQLKERINGLRPSVKTDYLKQEIFSKFVSDETDPPLVRRTRAINKWLAAERDNEATNERLMITPEDFQILPRVTFKSFVDRCRDIIVGIIGEVPPTETLIGSFSGGASTSRCRTKSHPAFKYIGQAHVTPRALPLFVDAVDLMPGWLNAKNSYLIETVPGNVLFTVPKKTDIDRVACKEPDLNMFIQKGIGSFLRESLRRTGINLNDQSINRSLAHRGSVTNELATIDLSSASDSVTTGLVALMLPEIWFTLLDSVRSPVTIIDGEEHLNEMFSSMGNGFTFELESLLFYAIARTVAFFRGVPGVISVYGDDIICPTEMSDYFIYVLGYFGFQVNLDKTFLDGPFRESCGGHFYDGRDITPFYIKEPIRELPDLIDAANKLREWASDKTSYGLFCEVLDPEVEDIWLWLKGMVPRCLWGGDDTSFKYQLVSHDTPRMRLQEEVRKGSTGIGGYYHWLNATWGRGEPPDFIRSMTGVSAKALLALWRIATKGRTDLRDGVMTSGRHTNLGRFRLRPVLQNTVTRLSAYFLHEM